jgi:hypothetical protein
LSKVARTLCPVCLTIDAFGWLRLGPSVLLLCTDGCEGRQLAAALDLDSWPEYVLPSDLLAKAKARATRRFAVLAVAVSR